MSGRSLTRKGRLTAICMLVCAVLVIGLALSGVLQITATRSPVAHVATK
jgi:hypothetical protein